MIELCLCPPADPPLPQEASYRRVEYSEDTRCWDLAHEGFWGPGAGSGVRVVAAALRHRIPSWGFLVIEPSSPGKLDTEKLTAAGVNPGPAYGKLKAGHKVSRFLQFPPVFAVLYNNAMMTQTQ